MGYTLIGNYVTVLSESGFRQAVLNTAIHRICECSNRNFSCIIHCGCNEFN